MLRRDGAKLGLNKPVHVDMLRIDGSGFTVINSLIANYYGDGEADLVIWPVSAGDYGKEMLAHPNETSDTIWKSIHQELRASQKLLASQHTRLLLVVIPQGEQISQLERGPRIEETGAFAYDVPTVFQAAQDMENQIAASGVPTLKLARAMQAFEDSGSRYPLYNAWDYHLSTQGSTWVGTRIYEELQRWRPWSSDSP
jgi:hypothetical protein